MNRLGSREWLIVWATVCIILTLTAITLIRRPRGLPETVPVAAPEQRTITVWVEGAVMHPRFYIFPEGATMGDLLRKVELSESAVTYKLRKREKLSDRQTVVIPHRQRPRRRPSNKG